MRILRTASRARNGIVAEIDIPLDNFYFPQDSGHVVGFEAKDVPEFGRRDTHYDYTLHMSASDFLHMIRSVANSDEVLSKDFLSSIRAEAYLLVKLLNKISA